ncbi:hypothetical protein N7509_009990 [Penicillium cosmopolitanum]|uniref:Uncharacterized protein n=1 Tax=Penicillium cosmopolitanum TaxID=1131564 RepID=A0A9W9VQS9_9EURO|nr:uncharacterized protein N7509_009990 [Penicillium cosmopolitanum]KAJ5387449.1 hypothetical protein N7509_009990 [Penicillium cosmopolitanum]
MTSQPDDRFDGGLVSPQWGCAYISRPINSRRAAFSARLWRRSSDKATFYEDLHFPASYKLVLAPASVADDPHHITGYVMAAPG